VRVIVTGSRNWMDQRAVDDALTRLFIRTAYLTVVHGGCPTGADDFAHQWVFSFPPHNGPLEEVFPARWEKYGKRAGPIRNAEMVKAGADLVLAFPLGGSKGTRHTIRLAQSAGIPVRIFEGEP